jgi:hypothetical protein
MVLSDPQSVVLQLLDPMFAAHKISPANLTKDDGTTLAKFEACMDHTETQLQLLFTTSPVKLDLLLVVGKPRKRAVTGPAIGYEHVVTVTPCAVTKYNSSGVVIVTASRMVDKAAQEIRRVINENMSGSMKLTAQETKTPERVGSLLVWGEPINIVYIQWVTVYGTYTTSSRRFGHYMREWRVGVALAGSAYSSIGASSGLGPWRVETSNPVRRMTIPGGTSVPQTSGSFHEEWSLAVRDHAGLTELLYATNIDGSANKAVTATARNTIGYMAFVDSAVTVTNATDARAVVVQTITFTGAVVHTVERRYDEAGDYWMVQGTADSVTITVV